MGAWEEGEEVWIWCGEVRRRSGGVESGDEVWGCGGVGEECSVGLSERRGSMRGDFACCGSGSCVFSCPVLCFLVLCMLYSYCAFSAS